MSEASENIDKLENLAERAKALAEQEPAQLWFAVLREDKTKVLLAGGMILAGVAIGAGTAGWLLADKRLRAEYNKRADKEIAEAKAFYKRLNKREGFATPQSAVGELHPSDTSLNEAADAMTRYQGDIHVPGPEPVAEVETKNVFTEAQTDDQWDQAVEESKRTASSEPYIIHHDEYMAAEPGFEQTTLTYYEGDNVLADEQDKDIPIPGDVVGDDNLARFGHGSGDANTLFVRNEKLEMDFEVVRSEGKFSHEVLGLEHSDSRDNRRSQIRKFRGGDE